jgi:Rrf2 family transcriptional regulator, iron-sulfur cluster assembly transcription factor
MFQISQTARYALRALACLAAGSCAPAFIQDISDCSGVPRPYLAKILRRLNEAGLVDAKRGHTGGVRLVRAAHDISLWDIVAAIDGDDCLAGCILGEAFCDDQRNCPMHRFWKKTRPAIRRELAGTPLAEVVAFGRGRARGGVPARGGSVP